MIPAKPTGVSLRSYRQSGAKKYDWKVENKMVDSFLKQFSNKNLSVCAHL